MMYLRTGDPVVHLEVDLGTIKAVIVAIGPTFYATSSEERYPLGTFSFGD